MVLASKPRFSFVLRSADSFKIFGPFLRQIFSRFADIEVDCHSISTKIDLLSCAPGLAPHEPQIHLFQHSELNSFSRFLDENPRDFVISICPWSELANSMQKHRAKGTKFIALPYLGEELWYALDDKENIQFWEKIYLSNPRIAAAKEKAVRHGIINESEAARFRFSGDVELDQRFQFSTLEVEKTLSLPTKPYILVSTFAPFYCVHWNRWQKLIYRNSFAAPSPAHLLYGQLSRFFVDARMPTSKISMREVFAWMKEYAQQYDLSLVAKTRDKHFGNSFLKTIFDEVYSHQCFYPFNSLFLCQKAEAFFGTLSAMSTEALSSGKPAVNFSPIDLSAYNEVRKAPGNEIGIWDDIMLKEGGLFHWHPYSRIIHLTSSYARTEFAELKKYHPREITPVGKDADSLRVSMGISGKLASDTILDDLLASH